MRNTAFRADVARSRWPAGQQYHQPQQQQQQQQQQPNYRRRREGFLSGVLADGGLAGTPAYGPHSGSSSGGGPSQQQQQQHMSDATAQHDATTLSAEVLNRADLEPRSVFLYGFVESDSLLQQTAQLLRLLADRCGPVTGAFRFFKTAPPGYDRGEYASVVFLIVFDRPAAAAASLRLSTERVAETMINVLPASAKRKSAAAARRIQESFLPADRRAGEVRSGRCRPWTPDDFSPSNRLWVLVLWRNSTYTVNWCEARAAAQRCDAVIIDDARVLISPAGLTTGAAATPLDAARDVNGSNNARRSDLYIDFENYGASDNDGGASPSLSSRKRARSSSSDPFAAQLASRHSGGGGAIPTSLGHDCASMGGGGGGGVRSAQQQYYDDKYGRFENSWDLHSDPYGIRSDVRRFARFGAHCARRLVRGVQGTLGNIASAGPATERPLLTDGNDNSTNSGGGEQHHHSYEPGVYNSTTDNTDNNISSYHPDTASSLPRRDADGESEEDAAARRHRRRAAAAANAATAAEARWVEAEVEAETARMRAGGQRRRYGGVELRRPHPVEASLVWMPGVQYLRPVMNLLGFWTHDEGRRRSSDTDNSNDKDAYLEEEGRRVLIDETGGRVVRARYERSGDDGNTTTTAITLASHLSLMTSRSPSPPPLFGPSAAAATSGGQAMYPHLQSRREPAALQDVSRLTADNISVHLRGSLARSPLLPPSSPASRGVQSRRSRGGAGVLLGRIASLVAAPGGDRSGGHYRDRDNYHRDDDDDDNNGYGNTTTVGHVQPFVADAPSSMPPPLHAYAAGGAAGGVVPVRSALKRPAARGSAALPPDSSNNDMPLTFALRRSQAPVNASTDSAASMDRRRAHRGGIHVLSVRPSQQESLADVSAVTVTSQYNRSGDTDYDIRFTGGTDTPTSQRARRTVTFHTAA